MSEITLKDIMRIAEEIKVKTNNIPKYIEVNKFWFNQQIEQGNVQMIEDADIKDKAPSGVYARIFGLEVHVSDDIDTYRFEF